MCDYAHAGHTHCIVYAGFRGFRGFVARKKSGCKLIGFSFVIPYDTRPTNVGGRFDQNVCYDMK